MSNFSLIEQKLQQFSKKFYTNELIKGSILFTSLGLLYLLITLFIEYFLWLRPTARTILFWLFVIVEFTLLVRFILFPLSKLFGLRAGISKEKASKIIGNHFPEVKDKLLNIIQLKENKTQSELLAASIEQKANQLEPIPFSKAINFSVNVKYLKYLAIPLLIWAIILFSGNSNKINQSFDRVVNHSIAYQPPAPFSFHLTVPKLEVIQGKSITVYIETKGEIIPEEVKINYNNEEYYLENNGGGLFSYTFEEVKDPIEFYVEANSITSGNYQIDIIKTPNIQNISLSLNYPKYVSKKNEVLPNATNITVPQGTIVKWTVKTTQTKEVKYILDNKNPVLFIQDSIDKFSYNKQILRNTNYAISTSNDALKDYEKLQFSINTIRDEAPTISVKSNIDSISRGPAYFAGQIGDDYGFTKLEMIYYDIQNPTKQEIKKISITKENVQSFFTSFPNDIQLIEGIEYEIYFKIYDNDGINGSKNAVSRKFSYRKKTEEEIENELLQEQQNYLENIQNSIDNQEKNKQELEKIQFDLQNKKKMNWNDQKKIENLIKRQEQYKKMMERQTDKLQESFSEKKEKNESLQKKKEQLQKRIEELKKLEKQKKLLDEIKKMAEKLQKEDLLKKSKELAQQNKQQEKSLERVLELAKRYYVEQKMNQISDKLDKLSKKQENLTDNKEEKNNEKNDSTQQKVKDKENKELQEKQNKIKKEFDDIKKDIDDLKKENEKLKEPMEIPKMEELQKETDNELKNAEENLKKNDKDSAKQNQKKASQKMQEMSKKMQQSMQMMSSAMQEENMEDLRSVVENLITFSFDQEKLMDWYSKSSSSHPEFGEKIRKQNQLKTYFEHIDDSLYVLSMRVPEISSEIQEHLATAHYNLDLSLENFSESRFRRGTSNQRYVMTASNELVNMLSNTLDAMQNPQPGSGSGKGKKGESFSLPDIIQKQKGLSEQMKQGMQQKGQEGKPNNGKDGKEGKKDGKQGQKGEGNPNEDLDGDLYQIYKEQSKLRQELENAIKEGGLKDGNAKKALKEMEQLENEILERGFNQNTLQRMQRLNYELLKLDKATFEQGKEKKRKSNTNIIEYNRNRAKEIEFKKLYYNQNEILNRQSLPLRKDYKKKVQEYFNNQNETKK
ncbi:DUF4175 family protein [Tenacibaculum sp. MEBiC06402]|uniref:DUF4175 family protein n=1 Tax=unclassified Tenacibaculum TaxID=2635139 RepID=UPI003B9B2396